MIDPKIYEDARDIAKNFVFRTLKVAGIPKDFEIQIAYGMACAYISNDQYALDFWHDLYLTELHAWAFVGDDAEFEREYDNYQLQLALDRAED
jgi:hypothetical protein